MTSRLPADIETRTPHDTADKTVYDKLGLVIEGFEHVVAVLANR